MKETATKTEANAAEVELAPKVATPRILRLVRGIQCKEGDPVSVVAPSLSTRQQEDSWQDLLIGGTRAYRDKRKALRIQIESVLSANDVAVERKVSLRDAAASLVEANQKALEKAWVSLREGNLEKRRAVNALSLFFENLRDAKDTLQGKVYAVNSNVKEMASKAGRAHVAKLLSKYIHCPDTREARGYILAPGWAGGTEALNELGRVTDKHRALLFTDAPFYSSMEELREAAKDGGILEGLAGEEIHHRHMILTGNWVRSEERFVGKHAQDKEELYIPPSAPWFGMYMDNIVQGKPWLPPIGYRNPIRGVNGVRIDLKLEEAETQGFNLLRKHRVNPCILLKPDTDRVVVYGPYALSKSGDGVQMGVAVVESELIRYAEWTINKYGLFDDLEEAETCVRNKLSEFVNNNSGAGRMFRAGSRVSVFADEEEKALIVEFSVRFREVSEVAEIRLTKPRKVEKAGEVAASSQRV